VVAVGLVSTVYGFAQAGGFPPLPAPLLAATPLVVASTMANLVLRFVRWQFLLRRLGVRLATIPALGAFVGSFAFLPVPLYVGQLAARVRLIPVDPARVPRIVFAFALEQILNVWALTLLAAAVVGWTAPAAAVAVALLAAVSPIRDRLLGWLERGTAPAAAMLATGPVERTPVPATLSGVVLAASAALSLAAWTFVVVAVLPLLWATGSPVDVLGGAGAVARSILVGAASLVPLGASVSGIDLLESLEGLGAAPAAAAATVFVFRAATAWLSGAVGGAAVVALHGRTGEHTHDHFDAIDSCYDAWLPPHYRGHLVGRKTAPMLERLSSLGPAPRGLDIGCGRGWYAARMRDAGAVIVGMDTSARQLVAAREHLGPASPLVQGTALALPFADASFDFAYVINVLHHVATPPEQRDAIAEIGRVIRPGGLVFVHEMSVRNPLFRLYLSYVYPITKGIEEGTEYYLDPRRLGDVRGLRLSAVRHFTFIPDFAPRGLLPWLAGIERRLEASALAPWAAHFVAVYERVTP
jgi:ubiquinone/menaquinone biosynthesis C-methylase UbiE